MKNRRTLLAGLLLAACLPLQAQMDVQFTDYTRLRTFFNPAASGTDGKLNVAAAYSMQFVGYDNAPATMYVGADLPAFFLNDHHGVGVNFLNDKAGMFVQTAIGLQYAVNARIGRKGRLAVGGQLTLVQEKLDPSDVKLEDQSDPAFPTSEVSGNKVDFGAGVYFYHPKFWVGASARHLSAPTILLNEKYEFSIDRAYYLMGGCNIRLKKSLLSLQPSFMVATDLTNWREDVQCRLVYDYEGRKMYIGVGYSPDISTSILIGGDFHGVSLGYSYQLYTSGIGMINGSHEITLGYQTDLDLAKKGRNKHKSVRFL